MHKFNKGDKVRLIVTDQDDRDAGLHNGDIFYIVEDNEIPFCSRRKDGLLNDSDSICFYVHQLELIEEIDGSMPIYLRFLLLASIVAIMFLTSSCSGYKVSVKDSKHTIEGKIQIIHDWGLDSVLDTFNDHCEGKYYIPDEVEKCKQDRIDAFFDLISKFKQPTKEE